MRPDPIIDALNAAGITHAFGLPGAQNLAVFEALRTSSLRTVVASHELGASFMANGYYRASGKVPLLATISGPGFTYAMSGLAEAWLDSAALVHLTSAPASEPGQAYQLQAIDQATMARPGTQGTPAT
jgi:thiamine pyrophosphate-dependent acetolactate synthase large subunit-like protein